MNAIIDFFTGIGNALLSLINFIIDFIGDLLWFIGFLGELLPAMPAFWTWLPPALGSLMILTISVVVILRILGRGD